MIVFIDIETTGLNPMQDRILQLSAVKVDEDFNEVGRWNHYIKPSGEYCISPSAQEVHGLSKEFIEENGESFALLAKDFISFIDGCDVAGYNSNNFDWKFIYNELQRCSIDLDMNRQFYDVLSIERKLHPNNLASVYERYEGRTMEEAGLSAHNAMADVLATATIMKHQLEALKSTDWEPVDTWPENKLLSPEGSIRDAGDPQRPIIVFAVGKYKDRDIYDIMKEDPGYCKWWSQNVASKVAREEVRKYCQERIAKEKQESI